MIIYLKNEQDFKDFANKTEGVVFYQVDGLDLNLYLVDENIIGIKLQADNLDEIETYLETNFKNYIEIKDIG